MTIAKFLTVFVCGFSIGMAAFAIFQTEGLSLGMIGILSTMFLSVLVVSTGSQIYVLLCEVRIRPKQQQTSP